MDQRIRKTNDHAQGLVSQKEGGRWVYSIEDSVDASIGWLEDYIENSGGKLIQQPETILTSWGSTERQ